MSSCLWEEQAFPLDSMAGDQRGFSVGIADTTVLVASPRADSPDGHIDVGSVRIYNSNNNNETHVLLGQSAHENWGHASALSGDGRTVVGGVSVFTRVPTAVRVYHHRTDNGIWAQRGYDLRGSDTLGEHTTAVAVSQNGTVVAVGYAFGNLPYLDGGRASIWELSGERWRRKGLSGLVGAEEGEQFGHSISLSADGDIVAVGAPFNRRTGGSVRIFEYADDGVWQPLGQTLTGDESPSHFFGYALDLSSDGSTIVIGSYNELDTQTGKVWVYTYDPSTEVWFVKGDAMYEEAVGGRAGFAVALSSDTSSVAVGAPLHGGTKGRVRVYEFVETAQQWLVKGNDLHGDLAGGNFGYSVSMSDDGGRLVVGSPFFEEDKRGKFNVYEWLGSSSGCLQEQPKLQTMLPSSLQNNDTLVFVLPLVAVVLLVLAMVLALIKKRLLEMRYWPKSQSVPKPKQEQECDHRVDYCICCCSQDTGRGYLEEGVQHVLDKQTSLRGAIINEGSPNNENEDDFTTVVHSCRFGIVFLTEHFLESDRLRRALNTLYHRYKDRASNPNFQLLLFYKRESLMKTVPEYRCFRFINAKIRIDGFENRQYLVQGVLPALFRTMSIELNAKDDEALQRHLNGLVESFHHLRG